MGDLADNRAEVGAAAFKPEISPHTVLGSRRAQVQRHAHAQLAAEGVAGKICRGARSATEGARCEIRVPDQEARAAQPARPDRHAVAAVAHTRGGVRLDAVDRGVALAGGNQLQAGVAGVGIVGDPATVDMGALDAPGRCVGLESAVADVLAPIGGANHRDVIEETGSLLDKKEMQLGFAGALVVADRVAQLLPRGLLGLVTGLPGRGDGIVLVGVNELEARAPAIGPDRPAPAVEVAHPVDRVAQGIDQLNILAAVGELALVGAHRIVDSVAHPHHLGILGDHEVAPRSERGAGFEGILDALAEPESRQINRRIPAVEKLDELPIAVLRGIVKDLVDHQVGGSLDLVGFAARGHGGDPVKAAAVRVALV